MTEIKRVIFNGPNSLWHDYGHPTLTLNPELKYQSIPGAQQVLDHLVKYQIPVRVIMQQAAPFYSRIQPALKRRVPNWHTRYYPSVEEVAFQVATSLRELHLDQHVVFIAVADPWARSEKMLNVSWTDDLPEIDECLAEVAGKVAIQLTNALFTHGIQANVSGDPEWRLPGPEMLWATHSDMEPGSADLLWSETLYVGPAGEKTTSRAVDQWAAKNAHMQFKPAQRMMDLLTLINQPPTTPQAIQTNFEDEYDLP